jgi:hypothetical protein
MSIFTLPRLVETTPFRHFQGGSLGSNPVGATARPSFARLFEPGRERRAYAWRTLHATLPVSDLGRAREFYEGRLGFETFDENEEGSTTEGLREPFSPCISLRLSEPIQAPESPSWSQMSKLKSRNSAPRGSCSKSTTYRRLKTENGIVTFRFYRVAWFKDPDGNILGVFQKYVVNHSDRQRPHSGCGTNGILAMVRGRGEPRRPRKTTPETWDACMCSERFEIPLPSATSPPPERSPRNILPFHPPSTGRTLTAKDVSAVGERKEKRCRSI